MIDFEADIYGQYARFSAVADLLEISALRGKSVSVETAIDWLSDVGIKPRDDLLLTDDGLADFDDGDAFEQSAAIVFDLLRDRAQTLNELYPFEITTGDIRKRDIDSSVYADVLALTLAHAYRIDTAPDRPTEVFERVVSNFFGERGWLSVHSGKFRGKFDANLVKIGQAIQIEMHPSAAPKSRYENDGKVDVVANFPWLDDRQGRLTAITQATLEKSSGWAKKANEPSPQKWRSWMNDHVEPLVFFAVPHHIEPKHFVDLLQSSQAILLDRLRLVLSISELPPETSTIRHHVETSELGID